MKEITITPEVQGKITSLRELAVSGANDPEQLTGAWKTYLEIKEGTVTHPIDRIAVSHVRTMVDVLQKGGTHEHNSTTISAVDGLKMDLGLMGSSKLLDPFEEEQLDNVKLFVENMSEVLIRKS